MSEQEIIRQRVGRLRVTRRAQVVLDYLVRGSFWGAVPAALAIFASKLWILPLNTYWLAGGLLAATIAGFAIRACFLRITPLSVANDIDLSLGLRERVSSALALSTPGAAALSAEKIRDLKRSTRLRQIPQAATAKPAASAPAASDPFVHALVHDAAKKIDKLPLRKVYPWHLPRAWRLALPALLIAATLSFVPQLNWFVSDSDRANAKLIQEQGHSLKELAKAIEEEAKKQNDPVMKKQAEEIRRVGEKLDQGQITKKEALKELQRLKEKLEAQSQPPAGEKQLLSKLGEELAKNPETKELGEKLMQGDFGELTKQLQQLAENLKSGKLSEEQLKQAKDVLQALDEALKNGGDQPGSEELQKHLQELKQSIAKQEELQQQLEQAMEGFQKELSEAAQQLSQNGMQQQAQQLQQLAQQMQQQLQQNGTVDPQTLEQMQQALQNAQESVQQNQQLSQQQQQQLQQSIQEAQQYLQGQDGQPGELKQSNQQAGQNQQQMAQQAQKSKECTEGG